MTKSVEIEQRVEAGRHIDFAFGSVTALGIVCVFAFGFLNFLDYEREKMANTLQPTVTQVVPPAVPVVTKDVKEENPALPEKKVLEVLPLQPVPTPAPPPVETRDNLVFASQEAGQVVVAGKPGCKSDACFVIPQDGEKVRRCGRPVLNGVPPDMPRAVLDKFVTDTLRAVCPSDGSAPSTNLKDEDNQQVGVLAYPNGTEVHITWFIK